MKEFSTIAFNTSTTVKAIKMSQRWDDVCVKIVVDADDKVYVKIHLACQEPRKKPVISKQNVRTNFQNAGEWVLPNIKRK